MQFKMQAIKITRKTYSIAVACLAPGFTMEPVKDVLGHYLVINHPRVRWTEDRNGNAYEHTLAITNKLYPKDDFHRTFGGTEVAGEFFNVEFIPLAPLTTAASGQVVYSSQPRRRYGPPTARRISSFER
jgi:hypothetical protein